MIRNSPTQELPQVQSPIDETNLALKQILAYSIGYYGSVLQVTGNSSYAKIMATNYLQSGLINIASTHPDWGTSFDLSNEVLSTNWYMNSSYSRGSMSVKYNLTGLGLTGITYQTSANLSAQVEFEPSANQAEVIVTGDSGPVVNLGQKNFKFYCYSYSNSSFELISPSTEPIAFANGTYLISIPNGVNPYSYAVQVVDQRGIMVTVWSFNHYLITLNWNSLYSTLQGETIVMEMLQNGTIRWLGQSLQSTQTLPIPPIPVKSIRINETTTNGKNNQVPFQIEDWNNNYTVPQGLTGNATIFSKRQMIVFLVNHNIAKVTVWWDGSDTAKQTSYAYTDRYFTNDNTATGILTNGILKLNISNWLTSTVGSSTATASFMGINSVTPIYGSAPAYVIFNGIVRDIVQQEAEWSDGVSNCPNVYSQIIITLPANATYYTYQLQLIFTQVPPASNKNRIITSMCPIQITGSTSSLQTENGTSGVYPVVNNSTGTSYTGTFYNASSVWQHHWSQFISGTAGTGIMFTDYANKMLYAFDTSTNKTGALTVSSTAKTILLLPVTRSSVSFQSAKNVIWYGAVVTFSKTTPIYNSSTKSGLWITVEDPPQLTIITNNLVSITVASRPSGSGYVKVDGNAITTPYAFGWTIGSNHTLQALSPPNGTSTRYVWMNWSDGGAKIHIYTVPSSSTTVTANWQTQYQVTFNYQVSGGGYGYSSPSVTYTSMGSKKSVTAGSTATVWVDSGSTYTYTNNPLVGSSSSERWDAISGMSGAITSSITISPTYYHQYYLTNSLLAGSVNSTTASPTSDSWYNSGSSVNVVLNYVWNVLASQSRSNLFSYTVDSSTTNVARSGTGTYSLPTITMTATHVISDTNRTQYYLVVNGGNSITYGTASPTGDNWYDSGTSTTVSSNWVWNTISGQSRTAITNWQLDGTNQNPTRQGSGTLTTSSIPMSTYHTVTFVSTTQYFLTVNGGNSITYGTASPTGDNWYDSGTSTTVSSNWVWNTISGQSRTAITNYAIDSTNQNPSRQDSGTFTTSSITMSAAHTVAFASTTQYYLTNNLLSGSQNTITSSPTSDSWYDSGTTVTVVLNYDWNVVNHQSQSNLISYTIGGSTTNVSRSESGTYTPSTITMSTYHTISDNSVTQYYVTITHTHNIGTTTPSGSAWYDAGSTISISVTWNGNHTFNKWTASTGSITFANPTSTSTTATINGYGTITATFSS
jgi:hypothetical protein